MIKSGMTLQLKFLLGIIVIVFPVLGVIFIWTGMQNEKQATEQVVNQARILARQIILTRKWITDCEGIMALRSSKGVKGTTFFYDDRVETQKGIYQKFTPSMVTTKLSDYSLREDLYQFRISSLTPLNPKNRPNDFEKKALRRFNQEGLEEVFEFYPNGDETYFQYLVPLRMDKACLECHKQQGFSKGAVGGGLSVILPISDMKASIVRDHIMLAFSGIGLVLLTVFILFFMLRRMVIKPLNELGEMTAEISKGNLDARVNIKTGDEFEKLGNTFNEMAQRIARGRDVLERRVEEATQELSEANRELKTLDKLKSDFLANMSHELRSPLTVLRGGIDYLSRTLKIEDNRNYIQIIDKNLNRLIHLVTDLFDFTKIEAKKIEWSFDLENLSVLTEEVIEIISPLALDKDISLVYENPGEIVLEFDLERIEQVIVNLLDNAIKYSEPSSKIMVKVAEDPDFATVSIKDQGGGISEENLEKIFEKFHTSPSSEGERKTEGTGLGLAICKGIIEAHGGRIWAENDDKMGSIFHFTLPKNRRS